jgi:hypothetical protein
MFKQKILMLLAATALCLSIVFANSARTQGVVYTYCTDEGYLYGYNIPCDNGLTPEQRAARKAEAERRARMTPEERAAEDARAAKQRAAEDARKQQERDAARAREIAEKNAKEAAYKTKIDTTLSQLGWAPSRRAEAERFVAMREAAERARPKTTPVNASPSPSKADNVPANPKPPKSCTSRAFGLPISGSGRSQSAAMSGLLSPACVRGGNESLKSVTVGAPTCTQRAVPSLNAPPVGKCLACIPESLAVAQFGYIPGKGYPPPAQEWVCKATAQCTVELCESGPSKVSSQ